MSSIVRVATVAILGASLLPSPALTQRPAPPSAATVEQQVDSLVRARLAEPNGPASVSVAIVRNGDVLVQRAWGTADVAADRAATEDMTYRIGSVSKQFTAALVLKLVDRGTLSLGDTLGQHLSGIRPEWGRITIEQLLNHTSGMHREYRRHAQSRTERVPSDTLLAWATRDTMDAAPGAQYSYSNAGYMILGVLVEKLHGKGYGEVLRDEIARPLGLTTLGWCTAPEKAATETKGHERSRDGTLQRAAVEVIPDLALGAGGICASAGDLARWNAALHGGRVLSQASYAAMTTPRGAAANEGYAFGVRSRPTTLGSVLSHDGATPGGFMSENSWFPGESLSISVLYNSEPTQGTRQIVPVLAHFALGRPLPGVPAATASGSASSASATADSLEKFVGFYASPVPDRGITITLEEGTLHGEPTGGQKQPLVLESGTTYFVGRAGSSTMVTFTRDADGTVSAMVLRQGSGERTFPKVR